ncbi:MAG: prolyl oligopeptidase family serine peptidase [Erythrobacter sp.]
MLTALFAILVFGVAPASAKTPLPIEAYGQLPGVEEVVLSPSGKRIAMLGEVKGKRVVLALENKKVIMAPMTVADLKIRYLKWIGEDQILIVSSQTEKLGANFTTDKHEFYVGRVIPVDSNKKAGIVFNREKKIVDAIMGSYGIREIDGKFYGFYGGVQLKEDNGFVLRFDHGRPNLYRFDFETMKAKKVQDAARAGFDKDWLVAADGSVAASLSTNETTGAWTLRNGRNNLLAQGKTASGRVFLSGLGYDGSTAILSERVGESSEWREYPLAGGEPSEFLPDIDWDRLHFSEKTGHLLGYLEDGSPPKPVFRDPSSIAAVNKVNVAFKSYEMDMMDWTDDLKRVVVRTSGNQDSGTWFSVDVENLAAEAIAYERISIGPEHVGKISTFEYTASDGTKMDGVLTLPQGKKAENLPLVMLPHGGPHSYSRPHFSWWAQAYASRGYAVFQPNFRGSTNRNRAFTRAGYGEWGRKMQTDKSDGIKALAKAGFIDPKRACIVGASYGGYAALAGVTIQQGLYRCAVSVAGVSDIKDMYQEDYKATGNDRTTKVALLEQLGPRDSWDEVSPLRLAANADAPILLIHGRDDTVVPYSHSTKMADKLKDAKKPHEFITLNGEDHWLSLSETRQQMLAAAVTFVEKHNPPD